MTKREQLAKNYKELKATNQALEKQSKILRKQMYSISVKYKELVKPLVDTVEMKNTTWTLDWDTIDPEYGRKTILMSDSNEMLDSIAQKLGIDLNVVYRAELEDWLEARVIKYYNLEKIADKYINEYYYDSIHDEIAVLVDFNSDGTVSLIDIHSEEKI